MRRQQRNRFRRQRRDTILGAQQVGEIARIVLQDLGIEKRLHVLDRAFPQRDAATSPCKALGPAQIPGRLRLRHPRVPHMPEILAPEVSVSGHATAPLLACFVNQY